MRKPAGVRPACSESMVLPTVLIACPSSEARMPGVNSPLGGVRAYPWVGWTGVEGAPSTSRRRSTDAGGRWHAVTGGWKPPATHVWMRPFVVATKLCVPNLRPRVVVRPALLDRLNAGLAEGSRLTL